MADNEIKLNFNGLGKVQKLFKATNTKYIKVGILGSTAAREQGGLNNAEIGLIQEFGRVEKPRIPPRSFLRMPLTTHLKDEIEKCKDFKKENIERAIEAGEAEILVKKLGALGEKIVLEAFKTSGDGKWEANAAYTVAMKGSSKPLIDTGELRKSITSEVAKK